MPASLVAAIIDAAALHGAAIPVLPVAETVKRIDGEIVTETVTAPLDPASALYSFQPQAVILAVQSYETAALREWLRVASEPRAGH